MSSCFDCPAEIGRIVFELAASDSTNTAYNLLFVSREVRNWIEPILYQRLSLIEATTKKRFTLCRFSRNNNQFFVDTVRELRLSAPGRYNEYIFIPGLFTSITHLYLRMNLQPTEIIKLERIAPVDHIPNLRHMRCLTQLIVDGYESTLSAATHPTITHLQICSSDEYACPSSLPPLLSRYPSLTHLMFNDDVCRTESKVGEVIGILRENFSLQCIAILISGLDVQSEATSVALRDLDPGLVLVNWGNPRGRDDIMDTDNILPRSFDFWAELGTFAKAAPVSDSRNA